LNRADGDLDGMGEPMWTWSVDAGRDCEDTMGPDCEVRWSVVDGSRVVCNGKEADLGSGGGVELRVGKAPGRLDGRSRFLSLGGEPRARPRSGKLLVEKGRPDFFIEIYGYKEASEAHHYNH